MFSMDGNFLIVFLIVYFKISQGINCIDETKETSADSTSNSIITSLTSSKEYVKIINEVDFAIIIYYSSGDSQSCETVYGILKELVAIEKYKNIKLYNVDLCNYKIITPGLNIAESLEIIGLRKGIGYIGGLDSESSLNKTLVESFLTTLLNENTV